MTPRARTLSAIAHICGVSLLTLGAFTFVCLKVTAAETSAEKLTANKVRILNETYARRAEKVYQDSLSKTSNLTVQELGNAALYLSMSQADSKKIEHLLRTEFSAQMMDDTYPSYGKLPTRINSAEITNSNSLELGCQALGPLLIGYENRLSPAFKKWLEPHLKAAMIALRKQNISVKNTSACLIKAVDLILIGANTFDGEASYEGGKLLDDWISYTKQSGIHEFNSPQVYEQNLNALNMGYLFAPDKLTKSKFKAILDYFWQDISAHYNPELRTLVGAHARDYDLLFGGGAINTYASLQGLPSQDSPVDYRANEVYTLLNAVDSRAYRPPKIYLDLATVFPRTVECRWDDSPANDTYTYITHDYSVGSASGGSFGETDKMLVGCFDNSALQNITVGSYIKKIETKLDEKRLLRFNEHCLNAPFMVQDKGKVLALLRIDTSKFGLNDELTTQFIFPYAVETILKDLHRENFDSLLALKPGEQSITCLGERDRTGAFLLKVFQADGLETASAPVEITATEQDQDSGIFKISIKHGRKQASSPAFLNVGFIMTAEHCENDDELLTAMKRLESASIKQRLNETGWQVDTKLDQTALTINRDFVKPADTTRFVNGIEVQSPIFSVNGTLLGPSMWRREDALLQRQTVSE